MTAFSPRLKSRSNRPPPPLRPNCQKVRQTAYRPIPQRALMDATKKRAQKLEAKGKLVVFKALLRMRPDGGDHEYPQP